MGSNQDWKHRYDPDARIAKMKDGSTHMAHKTENAVDFKTGAVVGITLQPADSGDTTTMIETQITASEQVEAVLPQGEGIQEVVADKGYYSTERIVKTWNKSDYVLMSLSQNKGAADGTVTTKHKRLFMETEGGSAANGERNCSDDEENSLNGHLRIFTKPGECVAYICGAGRIFSNEY